MELNASYHIITFKFLLIHVTKSTLGDRTSQNCDEKTPSWASEKVTRIRLDLPQFKYLPRISEPVFSLHYFLFFSLKIRLNFFGEALLWGATLVGAWKRIVPRGIGMIFMFFILFLKGFLDCRWSNLADLSSALGSVWKLTPVCRKWTWAPAI